MENKIFFYEGLHAADVFRVLWQNKIKIASFSFFAVILGLIYILASTPLYISQTIVAPKESDTRSSPILSQLSGIGGAGGSNLAWFAVVLNTVTTSEIVVSRNPDVYELLYPRLWDASTGRWKVDSADIPTVRSAAALLRRKYLTVSEDSKRGLLTVQVEALNPGMAKRLVEAYLEALVWHIKSNVIADAEASRAYLDSLLMESSDPALKIKISALSGVEIEKVLMVRSSPIQVLDPATTAGKPAKPRKLLILVASLVLGITFSSIVVVFSKMKQ